MVWHSSFQFFSTPTSSYFSSKGKIRVENHKEKRILFPDARVTYIFTYRINPTSIVASICIVFLVTEDLGIFQHGGMRTREMILYQSKKDFKITYTFIENNR